MPSRLIEKNERMRTGRNRKRDFFQMKRHGLAVAGGEDEPSLFHRPDRWRRRYRPMPSADHAARRGVFHAWPSGG